MCQRASEMTDGALAKQVREAESTRRRIFRPPVHAARHNNLRSELLATLTLLPFLQEGEKGGGKPIRSDGICAHGVVKVFLSSAPVTLHKLNG